MSAAVAEWVESIRGLPPTPEAVAHGQRVADLLALGSAEDA